MSNLQQLTTATCALIVAGLASPALAQRPVDVSPGPGRLPASQNQYVRFHFLSPAKSTETITASFQWNGSKNGCRIQIGGDVLLADEKGLFPASKATRQSNTHCAVAPKASIAVRGDARDATVPLAFHKAGSYRLSIHTASTGWRVVGDYQVTATTATDLSLRLIGVTPTQAVLAFNAAAGSSCQVQVSATKDDFGWDFSSPVPDTDPNLFPGADNAELNDGTSGSPNRGYTLPDGSRAIVLGKRAAEYSPYTTLMHSRALQAATSHQAWVSCDSGSGWIEFSTATIMPGISYSDPFPADPDRPGDYAYPTLSWTDRNPGVVDPQSGLMTRPVTFPSDSYLTPGFTDWLGPFGTPAAAYPARALPATSVFIPAALPKTIPSWYHLEVNSPQNSWKNIDATLTSFLPGALALSCPGCVNTKITICLTADGATCAVDRNLAADPNAPLDPNTRQRGVLGTTFNCTGNCSFSSTEARWKDATPVLASWHPNYAAGAANVVMPNFQFDSVKLRTGPVKCDGSTSVSRAPDGSGGFLGAPFNVLWTRGTPLTIDTGRYTVNQVVDEATVILNEACPASAQALTADTFGLLLVSPTPISRVVTDQWKAKLGGGMTTWDSSGDLQTYANCSRQPVIVGGKSGWHCTIGNNAYWIAADASKSLPLGSAGFVYNGNTSLASYCGAAFWDELDGNSMYCLAGALDKSGKKVIAQLTFFGDHKGLETAQFTNPDASSDYAYLPVCKTTNPPSPNNCWRITPMNTTGTNTLFVIEDAVRDAMPDAWKNSAFPPAMVDGQVTTTVNAKIDDSHLVATTWIFQNSYGFSSILELSTPRGSVKLRNVLSSWAGSPNTAAGSNPLRWSGIHNSGGSSWGPTKTAVFPTHFRGSGSPGQGFYKSKVLTTAPANCPTGTSGTCVSITIDGQPGEESPHRYEPVNDLKTRKPGWGYLTDLQPGDLMCAPLNNDLNTYCTNYIPNGRFENLRVVSTVTNASGAVTVLALRNVGGTVTMPLSGDQYLYMMSSACDFSAGYGCTTIATVWDWGTNSIESVDNGGQSHQMTVYDPVSSQVVSVTDGASQVDPVVCYSSTRSPNCYSIFGGKVDPAKKINTQLSNLFSGTLTGNPPFGVGTAALGVNGEGTPNDVDSHPGTQQMTAAAPNSEKVWFLDGRPFFGVGNYIPPPVQVATDVYRFPTPDDAPAAIEIYKRLPMMASCGMNVLREVTRISAQTPYTYCVALSGGDCMAGSVPGDAYVSCPLVKPSAKSTACPFAGIAGYTPEVRDTCLNVSGPFTMGLSQMGFASQTNGIWTMLPADRRARSGRLLTHGFGRYRTIDQYWNPKTTPDGGVLLYRAMFLGGYSTRLMMAKIPPFPDLLQDPLDRRGYIPTPLTIDPAPDGTTSVSVQFGYDANFRCSPRPEPCEARNDFDAAGLATPYYFASEKGPDGMSCTGGGCPASVNAPAISQRVVFYRAVYQVNGTAVTGPARVTVVPDPVPVPGNQLQQ